MGLFQWFSFAAMLSPYFKTFEGSDYGNKHNRIALPELECNRIVILALRNLYHQVAFIYLHLVSEVNFC